MHEKRKRVISANAELKHLNVCLSSNFYTLCDGSKLFLKAYLADDTILSVNASKYGILTIIELIQQDFLFKVHSSEISQKSSKG